MIASPELDIILDEGAAKAQAKASVMYRKVEQAMACAVNKKHIVDFQFVRKTMTKQEAMERFSSGAVQQSLEIHRGIQWTGRIIGLVVCALIVKYMPSDWVERVWYYLLLLVILWTLHRLGESQAFICEKGLVLKRGLFL